MKKRKIFIHALLIDIITTTTTIGHQFIYTELNDLFPHKCSGSLLISIHYRERLPLFLTTVPRHEKLPTLFSFQFSNPYPNSSPDHWESYSCTSGNGGNVSKTATATPPTPRTAAGSLQRPKRVSLHYVGPIQNFCKGSQEGACQVLQHQSFWLALLLSTPGVSPNIAGGSPVCSNGSSSRVEPRTGQELCDPREPACAKWINTTKGSSWWGGCTGFYSRLSIRKPTIITWYELLLALRPAELASLPWKTCAAQIYCPLCHHPSRDV